MKEIISTERPEKPLVSVCIPTYNSSKTLIKTLMSIMNQTYPNLEIIVLDNASTDNTRELLSSYIENKVINYYRNEKTIPPENNWCKSIKLAKGDYIAIFHSDDLYKPEMVEKQVQAFLHNPHIGAVFTLADVINEKDAKIDKRGLPSDLSNKEVYDFNDIFFSTLKNTNFLVCPSAMVKNEIYNELIPFDYKNFVSSADLDMWFRILEKYPIVILKENLMCYRLTKTQGTYQINYLRTEKPDFFKVMEYYISVKSDSINIPLDALKTYECIKNESNILIALNYMIQGHITESKSLLKETISLKLMLSAIKYRRYYLLTLIIWGIVTLISMYFGVWHYFKKFIHWNLYERG